MPEFFPCRAEHQPLARLLNIALSDTGQSRRVANFLLAWHNAIENGGWDPIDLWNVDTQIAEDILECLRIMRLEHAYPGELDAGRFKSPMERIWKIWRGANVY